MDLWIPLFVAVLMLLDDGLFADVQSSLWRLDVNYVNTEFQSFLSKSRVTLLEDCFLICSASPHCLFTTFRSSTRECTMYSVLEGPVQVTNTSLWKGCQQCLVVENGPTFIVFDKLMLNFDQANTTCVALGGHLVIPDTHEENEHLYWALRQKDDVEFYWIGGLKTANGWEWIDGRPLNTTDKTRSGGFISGNGNCVRFRIWHTRYKYDDAKCGRKLGFICETDRTSCCE